MTTWRRIAIAAFVCGLLMGCRLGDLVAPLPNYVETCVRWQTFTVAINGHSVTSRSCVERGWVRKVDTIPVVPIPGS